MFRILKNRRGQGHAVEYAVLFFLVVAALAAMSTYAKRGMQARVRGARNFMWLQVNATVNQYYANRIVPVEYEPYYLDTTTQKDERVVQTETDTPWAGHEGKFQSGISSYTQAQTNSTTSSAYYAD